MEVVGAALKVLALVARKKVSINKMADLVIKSSPPISISRGVVVYDRRQVDNERL